MRKLLIFFALLFFPSSVAAASYTWDGGGSTNNWSEAANWSSNIVPTSADTVTFNGTSVKDAVIDSSFGGQVDTMNISAGYTGTVIQERTFTVATVNHASSTFRGSSSTAHNINLTGTWNQTGTSTFISTAGTLLLTGNGKIQHTGSTGQVFSHNNGTVELRGNNVVAVSLNSNGAAGTITFYNVTLNNTGTFPTYLEGEDTLNVINDLNLIDGRVGSGKFVVLGNATTTGSFTVSSTYDGSYLSTGIIVSSTYAIPVSLPRITTLPFIDWRAPNAVLTWTGAGTAIGFINGSGQPSFAITTGTFAFPTSSLTSISLDGTYSQSGGSVSMGSASFTVSGSFTLSGGSFDGGTGTHTYSGTFTQSGGTYTKESGNVTYSSTWTLSGDASSHTASAGTSTVSGAWTKAIASTFNHNNGTYQTNISNATAFQIGANGGTGGTLTFYNLVWNASGNCGYIDSVDTISVLNNLTLSNGQLCGNNLYVVGNATTTGSVVFSSTFDGAYAGYQASNANVVVTGTYAIPVTFYAGTSLPGVIMNNPNAIATATGTGSVVCNNFSATYCFEVRSGTVNFGSVNFYSYQAYLQSGGTFNGGTGVNSYSTTFTLSGGTYNATTGTTAFAGNYTHTSGGTFNANGGLARFSGSSATVDVNSTETFSQLEIYKTSGNALTISSGDTLIATSTLTLVDGLVNTGTLEARGDVTVSSTYDATGTAPLLFSGSADQTFTLATTTVFDADITIRKTSSSSMVTLASAMVLNAASQDLTITTGTLNLAGYNLTVNGTSGTLVVSSDGTLKMQGGETLTLNSGQPTLRTGSTVAYTGSSSYTMKDFTYHNIRIEGPGTFTLAGNETLGGNLTVTTGTLALGGNDLTINPTSTYSNAGVTRLNGDETVSFTIDPTVGTVEYVGSGTYASLPAGNSYNDLIFSGAGVWEQTANVIVNGDITISNGSTLNSNGYAINLDGDWTNHGTYTPGANTVYLDGSLQTVFGTTTFYNLTKSPSSTDILFFSTNTPFTVSGVFAMKGSDAGLLSLRSMTTGSQWVLNLQGSADVLNLDVMDSNNTGVSIATAGLNITNSGNNTGWRFGGGGTTYSPPLAPSPEPVAPPPAPSVPVTVTTSTPSTTTTPAQPVVTPPTSTEPVVVVPPPVVDPVKPVTPAIPVIKPKPIEQFTRILSFGNIHAEVQKLQRLLNAQGFTVATRGAGSKGKETSYFGFATRNALLRFQKANDLRQSGQVDAATREVLNALVNEEVKEKPVEAVLEEKITVVSAFTRDLRTGDRNEEVRKLQIFLNKQGFIVAATGPGSSGNETTMFGRGTREALIRFQEAHASEILAPLRLKRGTGLFSARTRAVVNRLIAE